MLGGLVPDSINDAVGKWSFWAGVSIGVALSRGFWVQLESQLTSDKPIWDRLGGK